jgi:hypothetical protein
LEARNNRESKRISPGQNVTNSFKIQDLLLNKDLSLFHILDSLPDAYPPIREAMQLQTIFLKYFDGIQYEEDRIKCNVAKVILAPFLF